MFMKRNEFRYAGEFEKQEAVIICWADVPYSASGYDVHEVFVQMIKNIMEEADVYVNCGRDGSLARCKDVLKAGGIDIEKIHFTEFEDELYWARDYGPDILVDGCGNKRLVNFDFNSYGMCDTGDPVAALSKQFAPQMAAELGCTDVLESSLVTEGGDKEFNGAGICMIIEQTEVEKRNPSYTREQIEAEYKRLFHLKKVIWIPQASFEDEDIFDGPLDIINGEPVYRSLSANGHIDEICRFVDENTVLLAEVTEKEAQALPSARITKERLDKAYEILSKETDGEGRPFRIIRIPVPEPIYFTARPGDYIYESWQLFQQDVPAGGCMEDGSQFPKGEIRMQPALSYCNFLIVNGLVLGQKYWREGLPEAIREKDMHAREVLERVFPDRKVVMVHAVALNILGGGIHCITKNVPGVKIRGTE